MTGNLNTALLLLDRALEKMECESVTYALDAEEDTSNLDFIDDIKTAKAELMLFLGRDLDDE